MNRGKRATLVAAAFSLGVMFVAGCETCAQRGTAVGALFGAGIGQLIGRSPESTLTGAVIGGAGGYMLGNETDKRQARIERHHIREETRYVAVNITNSNGSISQVRLRRQGVGYVGTRGEYYHHLPTEDQLRPVYGF
ncbi:MAG: glycine zipper family protein [Phycisphaerales bacterium]|nr:MAG: glycine zipper family protein [Phycisphaerales bacterium]